jgi:ATP synthase, Delta/Epsilon chain, beta-sandwich domain
MALRRLSFSMADTGDAASAALTEKGDEKAPADSSLRDGKSMSVKVYSPRKIFFDERAASISAVNATGAFDILPMHHNFITLLSHCDMTIRRLDDKEEQHIRITGGLMHVKADEVTVFLDI